MVPCVSQVTISISPSPSMFRRHRDCSSEYSVITVWRVQPVAVCSYQKQTGIGLFTGKPFLRWTMISCRPSPFISAMDHAVRGRHRQTPGLPAWASCRCRGRDLPHQATFIAFASPHAVSCRHVGHRRRRPRRRPPDAFLRLIAVQICRFRPGILLRLARGISRQCMPVPAGPTRNFFVFRR